MTVSFRPAKRGQSYVMLGLAGYSGTGKTFSALRLARGLAGDKPFAVIDTEAGRAEHYDWLAQPWHHANLEPPFSPAAYLSAIKDAEKAGYPVIVVDSMSHEYSGPGGLQDQAEAELERMAGDDVRLRAKLGVSSWNKPKTDHRKFVEQLLRVRAHLILCFRAREAIEMRKNPQTGKTEIIPIESIPGHPGWLIETEHKSMPLPYELLLSVLLIPRPDGERGLPVPVKLEDQHRAFMPLDRPISEETGRLLAEWASNAAERDSAPAGLPQHRVDALVAARKEADPPDEWIHEKLAALGAEVPEGKITLATIRGLTDEQASGLLDALSDALEDRDAEVEF